MRFFTLLFILVVVFHVTVEACQQAPCPTWPHPTTRRPTPTPHIIISRHTRPTEDPLRAAHPNAKKCENDKDCRHPLMEREVPYCKDGFCANYTRKPRG